MSDQSSQAPEEIPAQTDAELEAPADAAAEGEPDAEVDAEGVEESETEIRGQVIIDLGKHSAKKVKALRAGRGKLLADVSDALALLAGEGELPADAAVVIVVVERKTTKGKRRR